MALAQNILAQRHHNALSGIRRRPQSAPSPYLNGLPQMNQSPHRPKTAKAKGRRGNSRPMSSSTAPVGRTNVSTSRPTSKRKPK